MSEDLDPRSRRKTWDKLAITFLRETGKNIVLPPTIWEKLIKDGVYMSKREMEESKFTLSEHEEKE